MTLPRWLIVGAGGQLGTATVEALAGRAEIVALRRSDLDVTDHDAVLAAVARERPGVILNASAQTAVDAAEDDPVRSLAVNAWAVQSLARAATAARATLIHYSTDFVFDGESDRPYTEEDRVAPPNVYGQTKLVGEWLAAEAPATYVLRVESLFGGPAAHSSIDRIVAALRARQPAKVFTDRVVTPSYVEDVVEATWRLVERRAPFGTYHVVNSGETTWYALGEEVASQLHVPASLVPVRLSEMQLKARRPRYCALSNGKLQSAGIAMPSWQDALRRHLARSA